MKAISKNTPTVVLKSVFRSFDRDNNQVLDLNEFGAFLDSIGITKKKYPKRRKALLALADENNDNEISEKEFIQFVHENDIGNLIKDNEMLQFLEDVKDIFSGFDNDGNGTIDKKEFLKYMKNEGHDKKTAMDFWNVIDSDGDGVITFVEFWRHSQEFNTDADDDE